MMIKLVEMAAVCDSGVTWPDVAIFGILALGAVAFFWVVSR